LVPSSNPSKATVTAIGAPVTMVCRVWFGRDWPLYSAAPVAGAVTAFSDTSSAPVTTEAPEYGIGSLFFGVAAPIGGLTPLKSSGLR
jgi:hypothetical protein